MRLSPNCAAARLDPNRARYACVYAVGLDSSERRDDAIQVLKNNLACHPDDRDTLVALIGFSREAGDAAAALRMKEDPSVFPPEPSQLSSCQKDVRFGSKADIASRPRHVRYSP
jgi:hypothetical protein